MVNASSRWQLIKIDTYRSYRIGHSGIQIQT